jgi:ankyrin repeat protein
MSSTICQTNRTIFACIRDLILSTVLLALSAWGTLFSQETANDLLIAAVDKREIAKVKELLRGGALVNFEQSGSGTTPLNAAILTQDPLLVKLLLDEGADVHFQTEHGETALIFAGFAAKGEVLETILKAPRVEINATNRYGLTPLMAAASSGNLASTRILLAHGARVDIQDKQGDSALIVGARQNASEVVKALLDAKANPNLENESRRSAIYYAVQHDNLGVVQYLLDQGASICEKTENGAATWKLASANPNVKLRMIVLKRLQECEIAEIEADDAKARRVRSKSEQQLDLSLAYVLTDRPDVSKVRELLKKGADPNYRPRDARPILYNAIETENLEIVKALIEHGADVNNISVRAGMSPLVIPCYKGQLGMVKLLLEAGVKLDVPSSGGDTPLMVASSHGFDEIVEELLKAKADPNRKAENGTTALMEACRRGHISVSKRLLEAGADPRACY